MHSFDKLIKNKSRYKFAVVEEESAFEMINPSQDWVTIKDLIRSYLVNTSREIFNHRHQRDHSSFRLFDQSYEFDLERETE